MISKTLVAEFVDLGDETAFPGYLRRNHPTLFPHAPERSRYDRRRRSLATITNVLRQRLQAQFWAALPADERDLCVIDSLPVPVVGFAPARDHHRWRGVAAHGHNASKKQTIYGFKLHLLTTHVELILDFALVSVSVAAGALTEGLLVEQTGLTVLGDKAYGHASLQERLRQQNAIDLLVPSRANARTPRPPALVCLMGHFRQAIETLNSQLADHFASERNRAGSLSGLCDCIQAKLTAHMLGLSLHHQVYRPLGALKSLARL